MPADQSNLSSSKYGYDFVVATTQESINAGLREYLHKAPQEPKVLCFLADDEGNPTKLIELEELKKRTGGIDPFDIKDGTDYSDSRITKLTAQGFEVGLRLKLGLPPGVRPRDLPIVALGASADNVRFNLYCSELTVIQNTPPGGFSRKGSWKVWSQPSGKPWYFSTTVDLVYKDLDAKLNTPYFNNHPEEKQKILAQLNNLGEAAFSLRQLLFDLDNAALESLPQVEGLEEGSAAKVVLGQSFLGAYVDHAREHGEPVLSVHVEVSNPNPSRLVLTASQKPVDWFHLTAMEREVCRFVDGNGVPVEHPAPEQVNITTLANLCAVNNHPLPGAASFNWNWVEPSDAQAMSGVVAINRNALAAYYKRQLQEFLSGKLVKVSTSISGPEQFTFSWDITTGGTLEDKDCVITPDGEKILTISYSSKSDAQQTNTVTYNFEFHLHSTYDCAVSFKAYQIIIVQKITIWMNVVKFRVGIPVPQDMAAAQGNVVDKTITDTYTLSVDQSGTLQPTLQSDTQDNSQMVDVSQFADFFMNINGLIDGIKNNASRVASTSFHSIPAATIQSFIFPGGRVFAFKDVRFSSHQDLVTEITYVTPTDKNPAFLTM